MAFYGSIVPESEMESDFGVSNLAIFGVCLIRFRGFRFKFLVVLYLTTLSSSRPSVSIARPHGPEYLEAKLNLCLLSTTSMVRAENAISIDFSNLSDILLGMRPDVAGRDLPLVNVTRDL